MNSRVSLAENLSFAVQAAEIIGWCKMSEEWIRFSDNLPGDGQKVMIKGNFPFEAVVIFRKTDTGGYILEKRSNISDFIVNQFYGATHWMPLPEVANE